MNSYMTRNSTADLNKGKYSTSTYSEMTQEQWTKLEQEYNASLKEGEAPITPIASL